jgi:hypothetical protein
MEAEEEDSRQVRQDVLRIYNELAEAQAREMQQIQEEETRRREEYIRNINAMNERFEQQKKQEEEEQKAMEEERKHEVQNKLELEQRLQTLERQGQHHEAQILSSDLNVLHLMQADNEEQCQAKIKKSITFTVQTETNGNKTWTGRGSCWKNGFNTFLKSGSDAKRGGLNLFPRELSIFK